MNAERDLTGANYRMDSLERRVAVIEATKPEVMAATLIILADEVHGLRRALYTFGLSVVAGAVVFAFSVFELLHP